MLAPLQPGDMIRVIAPSQSWLPKKDSQYQRAIARLEALSFKVTLGDLVKKQGSHMTASVNDRVKDLHDAYTDDQVKAIICLTGGWSSNELLPYIDWELVNRCPKPLIGFSDITTLLNAIYRKTDQVTLLGPTLGSIGARDCWEYSLDNLVQMLMTSSPITPSVEDKWKSGKKRYITPRPWRVLNSGFAQGRIVGGNLGTLYLLQGTEYMPLFDQDTVLVIEDDAEAGQYTAREFDRRLESLMQQPGARQYIKAVLVGRFETSSQVSRRELDDILRRKCGQSIPIICDISFGHTEPLLTIPIGGMANVNASSPRPAMTFDAYTCNERRKM